MAKVSLRVYNQEIEAMIDRGQLDEAVAHCRHILKTFPKHLETYRLLGKAYLEYKRYPEAADIFARVLLAIPSDFVANVCMSIIRDEENKLDDAIWYMERAFETQPSNAAIQSELQRLYGRRDGVQPPRIRMTRGALAHMYVQGELYPQAISEIKNVLKEDPNRMDMQVLLASAYHRSGMRNDAINVASALLRSNPYCFDANRVLVEVAERPEAAQAYRQRVVELDPYAAQVSSSVFSANEVPNMAVTLERLDWNGQSVETPQADWGAPQGISLEGGQRKDEQPDWLRDSGFPETAAPSQPTAVPAFDAAPPSASTPAEPEEEIPDFLRAAGWGASTGAFDESKSPFAEEEPAPTGQPIQQGDLPDWVKAMAPPQAAAQPPAAQEEELPDWINQIGSSPLPTSAGTDQPDWLKPAEQPAPPAQASQPTGDQPDWLQGFAAPEQPAAPAADDQPDWLKTLSGEAETAPPASEPAGDLDWLSQLSDESEAKPTAPASAAPSTDSDFDFLSELTAQTEQPAPASPPPAVPAPAADSLGMSSTEQDDSFAWLENLAAKQGATEGLLTKPEERLEEEPEWVKQAKGVGTGQPPTAAQPPVSQPPPSQPAPAAHVAELGKSEQEQDDSFAWLEGLAAKQGATEGLLTKPEERLEEEPEWVQQAKSLGEQPMPTAAAPEQPPQEVKTPVTEPAPSLEELGKSEQERDDSFAWLENLAAKQGATEGLLTKPEERLAEEPEWVRQAKDLEVPQPPAPTPVPEQPAAFDDTAAWLRSLDQDESAPAPETVPSSDSAAWFESPDESREVPAAPTPVPEQPAAFDDTAAWLRSLDQDESEPASETVPSSESAAWFESPDEPKDVPAAPVPIPVPPAETVPADDLPAWMQSLEEEPAIDSQALQEASATSKWMGAIEEKEEPAQPEAPKGDSSNLPSWLSGLDQEETQEPTVASDVNLPSWLRDETGELVTEPTKIEPTRATDWHPVEARESQPDAGTPPPPPPAEVAPKKPAPPKRAKEPAPRRVQETAPSLDPVLEEARSDLSRSNIPAALESYGKLIKKGRFLEDVIYDLREALYRYPVEVSIWQSLGDAYMRSNRLQDALDSYTKAEELLR